MSRKARIEDATMNPTLEERINYLSADLDSSESIQQSKTMNYRAGELAVV
jgi:hypothetical protein